MRLVLVKKVRRVKQEQMEPTVIKDRRVKIILQKDRRENKVLVKKVKREKKD